MPDGSPASTAPVPPASGEGTAAGRRRWAPGRSTGPRPLVRTAMVRQRGDLAAGSALVVLHQAGETLVPVVVGLVIDRAVVTGDGSALARWIGVLVLTFGVLAGSALSGRYLLERAGHWIAHDVRSQVLARVLDPRGGVERRTGEMVSLATNDADALSASAFAIGLSAGAVPALLGGVAILLAMSLQLGVVVLVGLPLMLVLVSVLSRPLVSRVEAEQAAVADASAVVTDLLEGLRVLKGIGAEGAASDRYRRASRSAQEARLRSASFLGAYDTMTLGVSGAFLVVVAWVGGRLALEGTITVGELVAAVGLAQFLIGPLAMLTTVGAQVAEVRGCGRRLEAFLATPVAVADHGPEGADDPGPVAGGDLSLRAVVWGPLRSVDLDIAAGELVGVVAEPAAAAALLDLLARRCDPVAGSVCLDGVPADRWALDELRRRLVVARYDGVVFSGSLADNVVPDPGGDLAAGADVAVALEASAAAQIVASLPEGAGTILAEGGRSLSGGQRQRVALARALATGAPVLVLHDPTTAVDAATEHAVAAGIAAARAGRTTVLVVSSPALLAVCQRVIVIRDGGVVAEGTHASLAAGDGAYREMVLA